MIGREGSGDRRRNRVPNEFVEYSFYFESGGSFAQKGAEETKREREEKIRNRFIHPSEA